MTNVVHLDKYKRLTNDYQDMDMFVKEHLNVESAFDTVDFWALRKGAYKTQSEGTFYKFIYELFSKANNFAPDTIKEFFKHPEYQLDYDVEDPQSSLYILSKGQFNGVNYVVKATSFNKYAMHNYILQKVN